MSRKVLALILAVGGMVHGQAVYAQEFPGLGVGHMVNEELRFQQQFYPWAMRGAWQAALATPNNVALPFNAMTISDSIRQGNMAFEGYIHQLQLNSNRISASNYRYGVHAIQGNGFYANPYGGGVYQLPYTHNTWNIDNYGYARPGYNPYSGMNVYSSPW